MDDNAAPVAGMAKVRFLHASPDAPAVDIAVAGGPVLFPDVAFKEHAGYASVPWLLIGIYIWSPSNDASPPGFVYAIFVSLFVCFNSFALNMVLQYKRVGPWRDYLVGEGAYIVLSLTAKTALAWQVFGGTLAT